MYLYMIIKFTELNTDDFAVRTDVRTVSTPAGILSEVDRY